MKSRLHENAWSKYEFRGERLSCMEVYWQTKPLGVNHRFPFVKKIKKKWYILVAVFNLNLYLTKILIPK